MMEEMNSLQKTDTYRIAQEKESYWLWVFAKKQRSLDGDIVRYKVRLVIKSYAQLEALTTMRYSHL